MNNNGLAALVGVFSMLTYILMLFYFWYWLFIKSMNCVGKDFDAVEIDYTGFKSFTFKKKCAYLYCRMWIEIVAIFIMVIFVSVIKDEGRKSYWANKTSRFSKIMWLGNNIGFLFILFFSIVGAILITSLTELIRC